MQLQEIKQINITNRGVGFELTFRYLFITEPRDGNTITESVAWTKIIAGLLRQHTDRTFFFKDLY